ARPAHLPPSPPPASLSPPSLARSPPPRVPLPSSLSLLSVLCSLDVHPSLHSFPTRRSSDLVFAAFAVFLFWFVSVRQSLLFMVRSEEHTSQLQSRFDLVCRLVLEKKKSTHRKATSVMSACA